LARGGVLNDGFSRLFELGEIKIGNVDT